MFGEEYPSNQLQTLLWTKDHCVKNLEVLVKKAKVIARKPLSTNGQRPTITYSNNTHNDRKIFGLYTFFLLKTLNIENKYRTSELIIGYIQQLNSYICTS